MNVRFAVLHNIVVYVYMQGFQGSLEVSNYPMISRSEEELKELARVHTLRSIELAEREVNLKSILIITVTCIKETLVLSGSS